MYLIIEPVSYLILLLTFLGHLQWNVLCTDIITSVITICLLSFFSLYELFPAFMCANNTWILVNSVYSLIVKTTYSSFTSFSPSVSDIVGIWSPSDHSIS